MGSESDPVIQMLIDEQIESNIVIQRLIRNFTKDSAERKLKGGYFEEKLRQLTHSWTQFKKNDAKLHENEYFTKANALEELVNKYEANFSDGIPSVSGPSQRPRETGENLEPKAQSSRGNEGEDLRLTSLKRRHEGRLDDMEDFLCNRTEGREVSTHVRQHMKELWKEIVTGYHDLIDLEPAIKMMDTPMTDFRLYEQNIFRF